MSQAQAGATIIEFPGRMRARPVTASPVKAAKRATPLHFRIDTGFYREFNRFCRKHGLRRDEALRLAFDLLRKKVDSGRTTKT
jgi:hypothetical protein